MSQRAACPFCESGAMVLSNTLACVRLDINPVNPVNPGHFLVIPFRQVADFFDTIDAERRAMQALVNSARALLDEKYKPNGYNLGVNVVGRRGKVGAPPVRRRWLLGSLAFARIVGMARMLPGGHFLADVLFAWLFVYFSLWPTDGILRILGWQDTNLKGSLEC